MEKPSKDKKKKQNVGRKAVNRLPCLDLNYSKHTSKHTCSNSAGDFLNYQEKPNIFPCKTFFCILSRETSSSKAFLVHFLSSIIREELCDKSEKQRATNYI